MAEARTSKNIKNETEEKTEETMEKMDNPQGEHLHKFSVRFDKKSKTFPVTCRQQSTVLEAIKCHLNDELLKMSDCKDENIIIQLGQDDKKYTVATHFPCCLIDDGTSLVVSSNSEKVEIQEEHVRTLQPKKNYSVFYIDTKGGKNALSKKIFRNNAVKAFSFLCVYGEKGLTVKQALEKDGRFSEYEYFEVSDNKDNERAFKSKTLVEDLHQKELKICLLRKTQPAAAEKSQGKCEMKSILDIARNSGKSLEKILDEKSSSVNVDESVDGLHQKTFKIRLPLTKRENVDNPTTFSSVNVDEIYQCLRQQFPDLKKWMESRFPGDSYQEALKLRNEKFGKIQQSFSEVHRVKKLLEMGKSVCKIIVTDVCRGTGFVLFDRFILTNAHLFDRCYQGKILLHHINVFALFNYDDPEPETNYYFFSAEKTFVDIDVELDYAVLELEPEGQKSNSTTKSENIKVPPGLLNRFGPLPGNGEACIIGHPAGGLKKIDPTCIIEPEKRKQAVDDHLAPYQGTIFIIQSIIETIRPQGIEKVMKKESKVETYHTFMYHGSSGSPVFGADYRVFGLHTAGFVYGFRGHEQSVMEYAQPLLTISERFVSNLRESGNNQMLEKVKKAVTDNNYLEKILQIEPMEVD
ncbi:hypothetical protein ILYODFUR_029869 [Ilyodon furcidens]|uniref:Protein FAM111A n=1 Tax=Ilyodon furcidens TaxID=33524 RepID=A0ABV0TC58_9TELE